jgi:hypothetical protein
MYECISKGAKNKNKNFNQIENFNLKIEENIDQNKKPNLIFNGDDF